VINPCKGAGGKTATAPRRTHHSGVSDGLESRFRNAERLQNVMTEKKCIRTTTSYTQA